MDRPPPPVKRVEPEAPNLEEVITFLRVFRNAETMPSAERRQKKQLLALHEHGEPSNYGTIATRLGKVIRFFFAQTRAWQARKNRGPGLELLFSKRSGEDAFAPTEAARWLYSRLRNLRDYYHATKAELGRFVDESAPPAVRLGAPVSLYQVLIAAAFGSWQELWGSELEFKPAADNTTELLPRLHAGQFDALLVYGPKHRVSPVHDMHVRYDPLGCAHRMVLVCHPCNPLWGRNGKPLNQGYKVPLSDQAAKRCRLDEIDLNEVDFRRTAFIQSPSWQQPPSIGALVEEWRKLGATIVETRALEEAVTLARLDLGAALVTELVCRRPGIKALRLTEPEQWERPLGVCVRITPRGTPEVTASTCRFLRFIKEYCSVFQKRLRRDDDLPGVGDPDYDALCKDFKNRFDESDWETAAENYPDMLDWPRPSSRRRWGGSATADRRH